MNYVGIYNTINKFYYVVDCKIINCENGMATVETEKGTLVAPLEKVFDNYDDCKASTLEVMKLRVDEIDAERRGLLDQIYRWENDNV